MQSEHQVASGMVTSPRAEDLHYALVIEWDPRDAIYVVTVPELAGCRTHGRTYAEAITRAQEAIEGWVAVALEDGETLPPLRIFDDRSHIAVR
jgi:predicted RNase H-like HicB family nuclease